MPAWGYHVFDVTTSEDARVVDMSSDRVLEVQSL
jgi:hypothetical protein